LGSDGGWAALYSFLLAGVSPGTEFLDASGVHSPFPGPSGRNGAVALCSSWGVVGLAWGLGI